jgi:hypothetical protein
VRAYAEGQPLCNPPLAVLLDVLLTRYPGYTAAALLEEDYHLVQALLDIAVAANEQG